MTTEPRLDAGLACLGTALLGVSRLFVCADSRGLHRLGSLGLHGLFGLLDAHGLARGTELVFGDALHDFLVAHGGVDILIVIDLDDLHALARELDTVGRQVLEDGSHLLAREIIVGKAALDDAALDLLARILDEVIKAGDELVVENALFGLRLLDCSRLLGCGFARLCRALLRGGSLCHVNPLF